MMKTTAFFSLLYHEHCHQRFPPNAAFALENKDPHMHGMTH